jgi:hypothetical protein
VNLVDSLAGSRQTARLYYKESVGFYTGRQCHYIRRVV